MGLFLLFAFTVIPLAELWLLIQIWEATSFSFTVVLVLLTGVVGAGLARLEGLRVVRNIQSEVGRGGVPGRELLEGAMILVAGVLLVTPGVMTDAVGFLILIGPVRRWVGGRLFEYFRGRVTIIYGGTGGGNRRDGMVDVEATIVSNDEETGDEADHDSNMHGKSLNTLQVGRDS
jgi:UPF0716 protein FxsA